MMRRRRRRAAISGGVAVGALVVGLLGSPAAFAVDAVSGSAQPLTTQPTTQTTTPQVTTQTPGGTATDGSQTSTDPTVPTNPAVPATAPAAPVASAVAGNGSATVSWAAPDDGGSRLTGFTVTTSPGGGSVTTGPEATSAVVSGLTNGTAYTFTVSASNAVGASDPSSPTVAVIPYGAPNAPSGVRLSTSDGAVSVIWTAPATNGQPLAGYRVDLTSVAGLPRSVTVGAADTHATVDGLRNGTTYSVTVSTVDATGASASAPAAAAVPGAAPAAPGLVRAAVGTSLLNGAPTAQVSWQAAVTGGTPVTGYLVTTSPGGQVSTVAANATSATVSGLRVAQPYTFTVAALSSSGTGATSVSSPLSVSVIDAFYAALGGPASYLGVPVGTESPLGVGSARSYSGGAIYWSPSTAAHAVHGLILARYLQLGGPTGFVGFPTSDESAAGPGRRSTFTGANLYWSPSTGTREVQGLIRALYLQMGDASSVLGLPTTDETSTPDRIGRYNQFAGGSIYWTPGTGAHEVQGAIRDRWIAGGWEQGMLGYPTSDEYSVPGGRRSDFQFGSITWTPSTGARTTVTRGDRIVAMARTHLGAPYAYGAAGPTYFDCSGLVQYVHRQLGINIPRTTWLQAPASRPIPQWAAMPGDVIFLLGGDHVGIYVGNGQMIDAPRSGEVVTQRAIWTSVYTVGRFW